MIDFQALVRAFHEASGQRVRSKPDMPLGIVEYQLRRRLIDEEALEACDALRIGRMEEIAGELADVLYVTFGTAVALGIDLAPVFAEVHRSNMAKVSGGVVRDASTGKILKPPGWTPPDVAAVLKAQGWRNTEDNDE